MKTSSRVQAATGSGKPGLGPAPEDPRKYLRNFLLHFRPTEVPERALRFSLAWGLGVASTTLLMLLMASIGLNAGGGIVEGLLSVGPAIVVGALLVATLPIGIGYVVGRKLLHLNPALLLGSLTGAMTSTPASDTQPSSSDLVMATARQMSAARCSRRAGRRRRRGRPSSQWSPPPPRR